MGRNSRNSRFAVYDPKLKTKFGVQFDLARTRNRVIRKPNDLLT
jgi:hypothetical protein